MERIHEWNTEGFLYSTDKSRLALPYIHKFLSERSYWAPGIPMELVKRSIENSLCFGIYHQTEQIGFARLVTDLATFGYLADVFIDEKFRGQGLSKKLVKFIFTVPELKHFRRMILATRDAHGLYEQYGFKPLVDPGKFMEWHQPDVYRQINTNTL
jgi:GNAT superfamily N-acetyltransferase